MRDILTNYTISLSHISEETILSALKKPKKFRRNPYLKDFGAVFVVRHSTIGIYNPNTADF